MPNPVVHFEIGCQNREKAAEFYRAVFDWDIAPPPLGTVKTGSGIEGHLTALGHEPHHYTMFYVEVADVAAALEKVKSLGGKTLVPPIKIPTGTFAWFADLDGNTIGLLQPNRA